MSKYPPCMMYPQYPAQFAGAGKPKKEKEVNVLKQYMDFQKFMKEMDKERKESEKKPDAPPQGKGVWHWVEEETPTKLSVLESMSILLLLSIPVAAAEVYGGTLLFRMATGG